MDHEPQGPPEDARDETAADAAARIDGRESFHRAVLTALDDCAREGAPQVWLCDPDFAHWPLGQPAVVEALTRWVNSRRRLTLIAADYGTFDARFPRWVAWRRQWSHVVQCLAVHEELAAKVPALLLAPGVVAVRLHDRERHRGIVERQATDLLRCHDLVDALSQRASDSFPVTTLGL